MRKFLQGYSYLISIAGIIIILDQWSKSWVRNNIPFGEKWAPLPWLEDYARIVHWNNTGAAFGLFRELGPVFTVLAIIVSLAILYYFPRIPRSDWPLRFALGLQLGGAVGNLIDRVVQGHVTDFISLFNFAVFNVADASISVGVAVLIIGVWLKERKEKADDDAKSASEQGRENVRDRLREEHWGD